MDDSNTAGRSLLSIVSEIASDVKEIKRDNHALRRENAELEVTVQSLKNQVDALKAENHKWSRMRREARRALDDESVDPSSPLRRNRRKTTNASPESNKKTKRGDQSDKNRLLSDVLIGLREQGCIDENNIANSIPPPDLVRNRNLLVYCLQFIGYAGPPECIDILASREPQDDAVVREAAENIVTACLATMKQFDGKGSKVRSVIALGARVRDYKSRIALAMGGDCTRMQVDFVPLDVLEEMERNNDVPDLPSDSSNS